MKIVKFDKKTWAEGLKQLPTSYRLIGPVEDSGFYRFKVLGEGELPDVGQANTRLSAKSMVYPQSEVMLEYSLDGGREDGHVIKETRSDYSPQVAVGIRPCDAKAFLLVRRNFDTPEYKDPYWIKRYEATTLVGIACNKPCRTCFCMDAGSGPFHEEGLDVLLVDAGDYYWAKVFSAKGEAVLKNAGWPQEDLTAEAEADIAGLKQTAEAIITTRLHTDKLKDKKVTDLFDAPFWETVAFACINCGTCTYVCPTCWCFDIQDEVKGTEGVRMRNWDSCMYPLFTLHGSGHNPRDNKTKRLRQRFMHKLKYYVDKYEDGIQCVGCGRCVELCPVNIDIRKVCEAMNNFEPE
jgi:ferredoxin